MSAFESSTHHTSAGLPPRRQGDSELVSTSMAIRPPPQQFSFVEAYLQSLPVVPEVLAHDPDVTVAQPLLEQGDNPPSITEEKPPYYVNCKQYDRIVKRREARCRMGLTRGQVRD